MAKKWIVGIATVAVIALFTLNNQEQAIAVSAHQVNFGDVEQTINNSRAGSVKACQRSKLSMPIGGRVEKLLVQQGDIVEKGDVLLTLWDKDQQAAVKQTKAQLKANLLQQQQTCLKASYADAEAKRQVNLKNDKLTSAQQFELAINQQQTLAAACEQQKVLVQQAEASLEMQHAILSQFQLVAPFSGVVAEINGEVGEFITPSPPGVPTPPAVDLINTECLYVTVPMDEIDVAQVAIGQSARVTLDAHDNTTFAAKVSRIAPYVNEFERQARTVDVELSFAQPPQQGQFLIGYSADAQIILSHKEKSLRVPTQAIMQNNLVFVINKDKRIEQRTLAIGLQNWTWTEVISGLQQGELVITSLGEQGVEVGTLVQTQLKADND